MKAIIIISALVLIIAFASFASHRIIKETRKFKDTEE
jgi:hypothetical protein